jgi:hypothetical protein
MSIVNNEANINITLHALQENPELSLRRAAQIYNTSRFALRRRMKGKASRRNTMPNSRKLSDLEEQTIVQYVLDLDSRGFSPRLRGVEEMANRLLADRDMPSVGPRWASNFVRRQPDLKTRFFRRYDF